MLFVIRYIRGFLTIKVWGFSPERFMNLCSNHHIFLWDITNHGEYYTMNIALKAFYRLRPVARKTGTRVVITKRYGLPFLSVKMWRRKFFLAGMVGSLAFWIWMSCFIWTIEIEGNYFVSTDVFMDFLDEQSVKSGMKKHRVDIEALEKEIRAHFHIITWTSARIDGTKLIIQIKENQMLEEDSQRVHTEEGMDLVASKEGMIMEIVTRTGIPRVKAGDTVSKGDILVEGGIPIMNDDATVRYYNYCIADADVKLQCIYTMKDEISEKYQKKLYTQRQRTRHFLMLGEKKIGLPQLGGSYEMYDVTEEKKQLKLFKNYYLPVYIGRKQIKEYVLEDKTYSEEEIKILFEERIYKFIETLKEKGVQIIEKNVTIKKTSGVWKLKVDFLAIEKTGILQKTQLVQVEEVVEENSE